MENERGHAGLVEHKFDLLLLQLVLMVLMMMMIDKKRGWRWRRNANADAGTVGRRHGAQRCNLIDARVDHVDERLLGTGTSGCGSDGSACG